MANADSTDALFAALTQQHAGVEQLLDSFFGFLSRKTDFYAVAQDPSARRMGFRPGQAQEMVLRSFSKYPFTDLDASPRASAASAAPNAAPVSRPVAPAKQSPPAPAVVQYTESGKQIPVGNGGAADSYTWTQSLEDVTIQLNVPEGTKSKDLDCRITTAHIRVGWKNDRSAVPLLDGDLPEKIRVDESVWSLEGNRTLQLSLEKIKPTWWASAFTGDSEIDTSRVDSTRKIDEYDATTQGAIRKAMFDQQQQQRGLRSSDDLILEQMLAKAKRAPHSPI